MPKRYVYKNASKRPVNIGGYRFEEGRELESDVWIGGFNEAVRNGFLELTERDPQGAEPDATPAPQTGDTGEVKVVFHMGLDAEGKEVFREAKIDPNAPVEFPDVNLEEGDIFDWFKDAEFTKCVNMKKVKAPKKGELHFYIRMGNQVRKSKEPPNSNEGADSTQTWDQSSPSEPSAEGSEKERS
jgi:hypothetical protein